MATTSTTSETEQISETVRDTTSGPPPPKSRPGPSRHKTPISIEISNKPAFTELSKKFNPSTPGPEAPTPSRKSTYFSKLDIAVRMELDHGTPFIIDVQPDLRFPLQYMLYNVSETYPDLTARSHPYTSTFTLVAYQQILFNAYLLLCDLHSRGVTSLHAQAFKNDAMKSDFLTKLMECHVPAPLEQLLVQFASTFDPQRPLMLFVPSFAGFDFNLDFGRIVPPSMMLLAHNFLASLRSTIDPESLLRTFYSTTILTIGNNTYTPTHFLGSHYDMNRRVARHKNWLNNRFEKVFNPVVGRALTQRPTLARTDLEFPEYHTANDVDPYELLLCYLPENISIMLDILNDVSSFIKEDCPGSPCLGSILDKATGITILYHSIWPSTLPTWHALKAPNPSVTSDTQLINDKKFATHINYMAPDPKFSSTLTPPPKGIDAKFYLVGTNPYDETNPPFPYSTFTPNRHVMPDVLWFQPYMKSPSALNYALTLGLIIENGEIDGTTIPVPNVTMSLTENNSLYLQGTLPATKVRAYIPTSADANAYFERDRTTHTSSEEPVGVAFRDCSTVVIPRFATESVRENMTGLFGVETRENCNDNTVAFTYCAWKNGTPPSIPSNYVNLWSSYRYVKSSATTRRTVFLYYTLRQFYGENTTLSRTRNPVLLLPS